MREFSKIEMDDFIILLKKVVGEDMMVFLNFSESNKTINLNETHSDTNQKSFSGRAGRKPKVELESLAYKVFLQQAHYEKKDEE